MEVQSGYCLLIVIILSGKSWASCLNVPTLEFIYECKFAPQLIKTVVENELQVISHRAELQRLIEENSRLVATATFS